MKIAIKNVKPYDGEYELDPDLSFNAREWRWVKKVSGYMPLTIEEGFAGDDPDLYIAFAVIAMCRDGKIDRDAGLEVAEVLAEVPFDGASITIIGDAEDTDEAPLASQSETGVPSPSVSLAKPSSSGAVSPTGSERSDATLSATTPMRSATSSA